MTAWMLLLCLGGLQRHGDSPPVGDQIQNKKQPQVFPIPTGAQPGPENSFITEWTTAGPTIRCARRDADGVVTEHAIGKSAGVRTVTLDGVTDIGRNWTTLLKSGGKMVTAIGVQRQVFLGNSWDGLLEIEASPSGARVAARLTYWPFTGIEYAVGFDSSRGLVVRHGHHYDDADLRERSFLCCIWCVLWVEWFGVPRDKNAAIINRRR